MFGEAEPTTRKIVWALLLTASVAALLPAGTVTVVGMLSGVVMEVVYLMSG